MKYAEKEKYWNQPKVVCCCFLVGLAGLPACPVDKPVSLFSTAYACVRLKLTLVKHQPWIKMGFGKSFLLILTLLGTTSIKTNSMN